ncbi:hypothetical protein TNCV_2496721 [Trichonephila clavipes]|nr:hypothetical protein TNCV_2496721 [Trichonephila clavipes]
MGFRFRKFAGQGRMSNPVKPLRVRRPGIVLLEYRVGCVLQQGQRKRLQNLYDNATHCQMAVNVNHRHPVIKV